MYITGHYARDSQSLSRRRVGFYKFSGSPLRSLVSFRISSKDDPPFPAEIILGLRVNSAHK